MIHYATDIPTDTGICEITDRTYVGIITNPCVIIGIVTTNVLIWIGYIIICLMIRNKNTRQCEQDEDMDNYEKKDKNDMDEEEPVIFIEADRCSRLNWGNMEWKVAEDDFKLKRNLSDQDCGLDSD